MCVRVFTCCVFFFMQKTAYEMRISDWSSDVCSSDLLAEAGNAVPVGVVLPAVAVLAGIVGCDIEVSDLIFGVDFADAADDVKVCTILHDVSPWVVSLLTHFEEAAVRRGQAEKRRVHTVETVGAQRRFSA